MRKLLYLIILIPSLLYSDGPIYTQKDPVTQQEFDNTYQDIRGIKYTYVHNVGTETIAGNKTFTGNVTVSGKLVGKGTATNDDAASGYIGEYVSSVVGPISVPTNNTWGDATSISLTAGDWDISLMGYFARNGATWQEVDIGVSNNSGISGSGLVVGNNRTIDSWGSTSSVITEKTSSVPSVRISITTNVTYYFKFLSVYSVATPNFYGRISARRVR